MSRFALSHGVLLFFFSLMLFGVQERTLVLFGHRILSFPIWLYTTYGIFVISISILCLIAVFRKRLAAKLENFLEEMPTSRYYKWLFQAFFWTAFLLVYLIGWLKGMTSIPVKEFTFQLVFLIGFIWFLIITMLWLKIIFQLRRWFK